MILTKQDLLIYITADRIMNGRSAKCGIKELISDFVSGNQGGLIIRYLRAMRMYAYYSNTTKKKQFCCVLVKLFWGRKFRKLGLRLGFSIGHNSLGYGVVLPHYGTIVVNGEAHVGNYAVLHTSTCIAGKKSIGDFLYLSTGSQIVGDIIIGDDVTVAAHSLVNHSTEGHVLLAGAPAEVKQYNYPKWIERDGEVFVNRLNRVEKYKSEIQR